MITIKIQGGLGNQMFQYAYGRKLEISGRKIVFDVSFFKGKKANINTARNFKLNNFNIETKAQFSDKQDKFQVFCNNQPAFDNKMKWKNPKGTGYKGTGYKGIGYKV